MRFSGHSRHAATLLLSTTVLSAAVIGGCGGGSSPPASSTPSSPPTPTATGPAAGGGPAPLSGEAVSAATGDIPDTQAFLSFRSRGEGYAMQYPEGWGQRGSGADVTFQDKNNVVHVLVSRGPAPDPAAVASQLTKSATSQLKLTKGPGTVSIQGAPVVTVSYSTVGAPNPVTGKRVELLVDRYVFSHAGRTATVDLGSPKGVDNIDAYRRMSRSFRWL